jgi:SMI1-KNR4 cell-wall
MADGTAVKVSRRASEEGRDLVRSLGTPSGVLLGAAEERLGLMFPPEYRSFLTEFGAAEVGTRPIYGVGSSLDSIGSLNVVWHTDFALANAMAIRTVHASPRTRRRALRGLVRWRRSGSSARKRSDPAATGAVVPSQSAIMMA